MDLLDWSDIQAGQVGAMMLTFIFAMLSNSSPVDQIGVCAL